MGGRLHLAGGEPTLCEDLPQLIRTAKAHGVGCRVLSNGISISPAMANDLAEAGCLGVQVSIEGLETTHDRIRGAGTFRKALDGTHRLRQAGVPVTFSMTLHQDNLSEIAATWELAKAHADRFYVSRLVPEGRGTALPPLSRLQWRDAMRILRRFASEGSIEVALRDPCFRASVVAPWHTAKASVVSGCAAGWQTLTVESDGTIMPCRRMGIVLGTLGDRPLMELWREHPVLQRLRDRNALEGACGRCSYRWVCGGCRALPASSGHPFGADLQCPIGTPQGYARNILGHAFDFASWHVARILKG